MTNPPDFDDRLTSYLVSSPIRDVDPGAAHIASRARRRTKHRRVASGAIASVALLTSAGVVVNRIQAPGTVRTGTAKVKPATNDTTTTETTVSQSLITTAASLAPAGVGGGGIDPSTLKWPASNITWQRVDSSLSIVNYYGTPNQGIRKDGDTFLAVSTEPSQGKLPNPNDLYAPKSALYSSKDGISWQQRMIPDLSIGGATLADGALYAVGTSTAAAQVFSTGDGNTVADLVVAVSKDEKIWKNQTLPIDLRGLANKGANISLGSTQIAHVGKTVLIQVSVQVFLDAAKYLPKDVPITKWGYEQRGDAFVVYGPPSAEVVACEAQVRAGKDSGSPAPTAFATIAPVGTTSVAVESTPTTLPAAGTPGVMSPECEAGMQAPQPVAGTYKFADLGVDPAIVAAAQNPVHLFASTNGEPFVSVQTPDTVRGLYNSTGFLTSVTDGVLVGRTSYVNDAVGSQVVTTNVVQSVDGKTWTDFGSINGQAVSSGEVDGRFTMVVTDNRGSAKLVRLKNDGSGLEDVSDSSSPTAAALATLGYQTTMGGAGFLAIFANQWMFTGVSVKHRGFTFLVTQNPSTGIQQVKVTEDATGAVVADGSLAPAEKSDPNLKLDKHIKWLSDSQTDISIVDDSGKTLVSIGVADLINQVSQLQLAETTKGMRILDSQDGATWAATNVSDLVDLTKVPVIGSSNLIVDKDRYIVNLLVARTDGGPADTITFVGRRGTAP
jgi:hypothetical protein